MLEPRRTSPSDPNFRGLVAELDRDLWRRYPTTQQNYLSGNEIAPDAKAVVAYLDGEAIGCACFRPGPRPASAELKRMYVRPQWRGGPAASAILGYIEDWAREERCSSLVLETGVAQPEALRFYAKRGFSPTLKYGDYYGNPQSVCMAKRIGGSAAGLELGMPTLAELEGLEPNAELCGELGLDFIELNANLPAFQPDRVDRALAGRLRAEGLSLSYHLPEDLDIAQFSNTIRGAHLAVLLEAVDLCAELGIAKLNMHMGAGIQFTLPDSKLMLYDRYQDEYLGNIERGLALVAPRLKASGAMLLIENTGIFDRPYLRRAVDLLLSCPYVGLTWDIGHDHSAGRVDSPFIRERADRVRHMHLHDARGANNHLPLYSGEIDIGAALGFARERGCSCVLETKTKQGLASSAASLR